MDTRPGADNVDWAKLEDVDRRQGLDYGDKRSLGRVARHADRGSSRSSYSSSSRPSSGSTGSSYATTEGDRVFSAWADQHVGPSSLPTIQFTQGFLDESVAAIIPSRQGLFRDLKAGMWILYHAHNGLYWGCVRGSDNWRVTPARRRVHITTLDVRAELLRRRVQDPTIPNLVLLLNDQRWSVRNRAGCR